LLRWLDNGQGSVSSIEPIYLRKNQNARLSDGRVRRCRGNYGSLRTLHLWRM